MEQGHSQPATVPTLSALSHRSDAILVEIVKYAESLNRGTLCVTLEDEQGRFRIWASNLGALQAADSLKSLDRRLKDAPLMRKSVISGLERLEGSAKRALAILNKTAPNRLISGDDAKPTTELDELLLSIRSAINHLFGLSMLIRRQRPRGRIPELEEIALESSPDVSYLTDKFPKAKSNLWLARRLGNNITRQRRLIQYRQHHRESLAKRDVKGSDLTDAATIVATTFQEESNASGTSQTPQDADSSRMSVFTSATSFLSLEDGTSTGRSIPDLSDMTLDGVQLDYGEPFECPYCRTIQNVGNRYEWKRHVFTDLQPYVCTFKNCTISNKSFPTRAEWFQHESTVHRLQWSCNWCSQTDTIFNGAEELKKHLNNTHSGMVTEAQMPMILESCERPIKSFGSDSCPLCADWEPPSAKENAKAFSRHLARHLQQLALEALPLAIDGLEIRDTSGLSDEESSLSYRSNEEAVRNQVDEPNDPPSVIVQDEERDVRADISESPLMEGQREANGESLLEQPESEAPVTPEAAEISQTGEDATVLETDIGESAFNRADNLTNNHEHPMGGAGTTTGANIQEEDMDIHALTESFRGLTDGPKKHHEAKSQPGDSKDNADKAPIRFKDAVGRKFSFPFHLCATWQGMEELIKQAFLHVDVIGPHVMEGHYDLKGPYGEIILPPVWEKVIQPDMSITMVMWPMDDIPPPPAPGPYRSVGPLPGKTPSGLGMAAFLFGKAEKKKKKKKAVPSSSADQQIQE